MFATLKHLISPYARIRELESRVAELQDDIQACVRIASGQHIAVDGTATQAATELKNDIDHAWGCHRKEERARKEVEFDLAKIRQDNERAALLVASCVKGFEGASQDKLFLRNHFGIAD